ncbi:MAG: penicillin-insensitive murein endopeptidase [Methylomonas sp.]|nr:penicillin-insensitive murein endopeptidase [Methylomonas sp.]PPD20969.1 MAG: penicillin-insensitive murein endopeptidase [Methylomonas sp.]PPD27214.1 MAG: penicillin-insensitive murein endopeptidase [Methylomonas sp.]PPD39164.1 MAG: penicillin-insensitive murein endopeptidase [Methylomonas sp.]PPD41323.1 MAG: penicillin-insensitive murein endopeptidase [Methylomonas sp.]
MRNIVVFAIASVFASPALAGSTAQDWARVTAPTPKAGAAQSIGTYTSGCVAGATRLPVNGTGYQVMRLSRNRFFGHDDLIGFIEDLGRFAAGQQLGTVLVGDLGQPRGGPTLTGHRSHQSGLDVDIWFTLTTPANERLLSENERETLSAPSLVNLQTDALDYRQWSSAQASLLEYAARHADVDRIFVHASIKRELCQKTPAASNQWLRKIRPWWKHDDHFHVRLKCPDGSPGCQSQEALPAGSGCDAGLDWWFSAEAKLPSKAKPLPPPPLPIQCEQVLRQGD